MFVGQKWSLLYPASTTSSPAPALGFSNVDIDVYQNSLQSNETFNLRKVEKGFAARVRGSKDVLIISSLYNIITSSKLSKVSTKRGKQGVTRRLLDVKIE